jgi:ubiquinone/menaquinone biosynthesis C-methylase UbiE
MSPAGYLLPLAGVIALSVIGLRIVSRRQSTACPAWLIPLLENPYMNTVAGSQLLLDRADVRVGMSVLDVGCGPGRLAIPAARKVAPGGRVVALDLQAAMIRRLEERIGALAIDNIEVVLGGAGEGKVGRNEFDRAFLVTVLGEIVEQTAALQEIYAALKPGGMLSVTEVLPDPHYQSRRRVRRLAEAVGFEFIETLGPSYAFTMNLGKPSIRDG